MRRKHSNTFSPGIKLILAMFTMCAVLAVPVTTQAWSPSYLNNIKGFIQEMHIEDSTDEQMLANAIDGMLTALDPYSEFMDMEETRQYRESMSGQFGGIGASLELSDEGNGVRIATVFEETPAERAGIREGDIIIGVDGESLSGLSVADAVQLIRGEPVTDVVLQIKRGAREFSLTITRGIIVLRNVSWRMDGNIGYVRIAQFSSGTSRELSSALNAIRRSGSNRLILDLRDNPGGSLNEAVETVRLLVPPGPVVTVDYKSERMTDVSYSSNNPDPKWLIAVLVNGNSASASEIVAGAIQDAGNGFLVGEQTFGKGVVQSLFMFLRPEAVERYEEQYQSNFVTDVEWFSFHGLAVDEEDLLGLAKITTGRYLTREGREINEKGLTPDAAAENRSKANEVDISIAEPIVFTEILDLGDYAIAVRRAETILKAAGFLQGEPDRAFDASTSEALKNYQRTVGLRVTSVLDSQTAAALNRRLGFMRLENDPQYSAAIKNLRMFR